MSQFQVGDRVVVNVVGQYEGKEASIVKIETPTPPFFFNIGLKIDKYTLWFGESELTKIDAPVSLAGKRVKLTQGESVVFATVEPYEGDDVELRATIEGKRPVIGFSRKDWKVEVLPEPIVLPTGKYALVMVTFGTSNKLMRRIDSHTWAETNGHFEREEWVQRAADYNPEGYRVIFEGE